MLRKFLSGTNLARHRSSLPLNSSLRTPALPASQALAQIVFRWRFGILALVALVAFIRYVVNDVTKGVGGTGAANIFFQCMFKSYAHVEDYHKSGEKYTNVTDILTNHGRRPEGVTTLSSEFSTDKGSRCALY